MDVKVGGISKRALFRMIATELEYCCIHSKRCRKNIIVKEIDVQMMCTCPGSKDVQQAGLYILSHLDSYT
jgi:hypothetical protein